MSASLRGRPDSEHEMSFNRLIFCALIAAYLLMLRPPSMLAGLAVVLVCILVAIAVFIHIIIDPKPSAARRFIVLLSDLGGISLQLHFGDAYGAMFFSIFFWVIIGNGFRFGVQALFTAMTVSIVGFLGVIITTPFWRNQGPLSCGLMFGLFIIPLYASTLIRKLSDARRQAEAASEAKTLFLASVSHELRTPLTAIIGMSALLQDTSIDTEQQEMIRTVSTAGRSLQSLINSVLDFSRLEAGRMPSNLVDFDLLTTLAEIQAMVVTQARTKGIAVSAHVSARTPVHLIGDELHCREILLNLVGNAVKFTDTGNVTIAVDGTMLPSGRVRLRVEVSDSGIGIQKDALGHIFDSFSQADNTIIDRYGGTGLGLAICKRLVELLGGEIGVESTVDVGSVFWFALDLGKSDMIVVKPRFDGTLALVASADPTVTGHMLAQCAELGVDCVTADTPAHMIASLRRSGIGSARRRVIFLHRQGLSGDVGALAAALRPLNTDGKQSLVLIDDAIDEGLPSVALRSHFATIIRSNSANGVLRQAFSIAGAQLINDQSSPSVSVTRAAVRQFRILVADDNRTNQRVVAKILESVGHTCEIVQNGEEALDALDQGIFDLVLMDVNMPVMNGIEATKLYRFATMDQPHLPIIALTADATPETARLCLNAGMDACITKPIEPLRLFEVIETIVPVSAGQLSSQSDPVVTEIASHPRFRRSETSPLDEKILARLQDLGGEGFIKELMEEFVRDADVLVKQMAAAAAAVDVRYFRDRAHALRSGAGNVGATGLHELCLSWRRIDADELESEGPRHIERLTAELDRIRRVVAKYQVKTETSLE